jgi:hypothetical protein
MSSLSNLEYALDLLQTKCITNTKNQSKREKYEDLFSKIEKDIERRIDN